MVGLATLDRRSPAAGAAGPPAPSSPGRPPVRQRRHARGADPGLPRPRRVGPPRRDLGHDGAPRPRRDDPGAPPPSRPGARRPGGGEPRRSKRPAAFGDTAPGSAYPADALAAWAPPSLEIAAVPFERSGRWARRTLGPSGYSALVGGDLAPIPATGASAHRTSRATRTATCSPSSSTSPASGCSSIPGCTPTTTLPGESSAGPPASTRPRASPGWSRPRLAAASAVAVLGSPVESAPHPRRLAVHRRGRGVRSDPPDPCRRAGSPSPASASRWSTSSIAPPLLGGADLRARRRADPRAGPGQRALPASRSTSPTTAPPRWSAPTSRTTSASGLRPRGFASTRPHPAR